MLGDRSNDVRPSRPIPKDAEKHRKSLQQWYPEERVGSASDTFEIALVLAGAVSAGAYTAGVMDFLFEALDAWYARRKNDDRLPNHNVVVRVIAGASAGGINGAIASAACRYRFPPVNLRNVQQNGSNNPFFSTWVTDIDILRLLDTSDLKQSGRLRSLLNSEVLDKLALGIVGMEGKAIPNPAIRGWLADPFRLLLTVTNLTGVPYDVRFTGATDFSHEMVMHRDHMGFSVPVFTNPIPDDDLPPDLVLLPAVNDADDPGWQSLAVTALASGAFPLALAARSLSRPGSDYDYRFVFSHAVQHVVYSKPKIDRDGPFRFEAVDGGTMNNEPFELARVALAGSKGRNPRGGVEAHRAVIMVDPFVDPRSDPPSSQCSLWGTFVALMKAFKAQTRFNQIDLTLAEADDVYSRFMIAPSRNGIRGSDAIASGGLRGFLGFFCKDYRLHDYMLGRANCQRFLREWFVLPSDHEAPGKFSKTGNPLFQNWPRAALDNDAYWSCARPGHRQIVPLVGTAAEDQTLATWPEGKFLGYTSVKSQIERRIGAAYPQLVDELMEAFCKETSTFSWVCRSFVCVGAWLAWKIVLRNKVRDRLKQLIDDARKAVDDRAADFRVNDRDAPR